MVRRGELEQETSKNRTARTINQERTTRTEQENQDRKAGTVYLEED
jgi:hypothetical protein